MELGAGETLTVAEALERMITISDNTSAVMLGSRVGGQRINSTLAALGMDTTHYSLERMTTSALDMARLLELLAEGKAVSPQASADMVHLLLRQRVNDRLPRLLPDDVQVAHKTGNLPGTVNDVGILYGPSATVVIAALVSDTTDEAAAANGIARAAQAAYTFFDDLPEVVGRPLVPPAPARTVPPVWREPRPTPVVVPTPLEPAEVGSSEGTPEATATAGSGAGLGTGTASGTAVATATALTSGTPASTATPGSNLAGGTSGAPTVQPTALPVQSQRVPTSTPVPPVTSPIQAAPTAAPPTQPAQPAVQAATPKPAATVAPAAATVVPATATPARAPGSTRPAAPTPVRHE
jgi:hypothetical protein